MRFERAAAHCVDDRARCTSCARIVTTVAAGSVTLLLMRLLSLFISSRECGSRVAGRDARHAQCSDDLAAFVVGMAPTGLSRLKLRPRQRPSLLTHDLPTKRSCASDTWIATATVTKLA
jgi:hypothetical protein